MGTSSAATMVIGCILMLAGVVFAFAGDHALPVPLTIAGAGFFLGGAVLTRSAKA